MEEMLWARYGEGGWSFRALSRVSQHLPVFTKGGSSPNLVLISASSVGPLPFPKVGGCG